VFILACTSLARLEIARAQVPREIDHVARAADARGDWDPGQLAALGVDAGSAGELDRSVSALRRERMALGDSDPPHMAEVIGRAIMAHRVPSGRAPDQRMPKDNAPVWSTVSASSQADRDP
jgi:hypothetical protein